MPTPLNFAQVCLLHANVAPSSNPSNSAFSICIQGVLNDQEDDDGLARAVRRQRICRR